MIGATLTTDRFGIPGKAYEFNGINEYITVPDSPSLRSPSSALTISVWANAYSFTCSGGPCSSGWVPFLAKSDTSDHGQYALNFASSGNFYFEFIGVGQSVPFPSLPSFGQWHHYAVTYDGQYVRFYFDGGYIGSAALSGALPQNTRPLLIGADPPGLTEYFNGKLDEIRIYNRALSTSEIMALYSLDRMLTSITINGSTTVPAGGVAIYQCIASFSDGSTQDMSVQTRWGFDSQPPAGIRFEGNTLFAGADIGTPQVLKIKATLTFGSETRTTIYSVNNIPVLSARISTSGSHFNCASMNWTAALNASAVGGAPGAVTFKWDLNGDGAFDDGTGAQQTLSRSVTGYLLVGVEATDSSNAKAYAYYRLSFQRPDGFFCSGTEFPFPPPQALDVTGGDVFDRQHNPYVPDGSRVNNGIAIIIHGMCSSSALVWPQVMGTAIVNRLSSNPPNVALYDWSSMATPAVFAGVDKCLNDVDLNDVDCESIELLLQVRKNALFHGQKLAEWIRAQVQLGTINPSKPIHLIGHSAGGFIAGESGLLLKRLGIANVHVTMLDTPHPERSHFTDFQNPQKVERYITEFGRLAPQIDGPNPLNLGVLAKIFNDCGKLPTTTRPEVAPSTYYLRREAFESLDCPRRPGVDLHEFAHEWYQCTIANTSIHDGFWYSPWLGNTFPASLTSTLAARSGVEAASSVSSVTGFSAYGNVTTNGGSYAITENADAGIFKRLSLPLGAEALRFRFQFTNAGDGDFLSVHWGSNEVLFTGLDLPLSRSNAVPAEISLAPFAGQTNYLIFNLVSRGSSNAVLVIDQIELVESDDLDGDGLTLAQELALGTNPLLADTDGDGITDGDEVNTYQTNPLAKDTDGDGVDDGQEIAAGTDPKLNASHFGITAIRRGSNTTVSIEWKGATNRTCRVERAWALPFENFSCLATNGPGTSATNTFVDLKATNSVLFYRISVE